jgi:hypothetical protein
MIWYSARATQLRSIAGTPRGQRQARAVRPRIHRVWSKVMMLDRYVRAHKRYGAMAA